MTRSLLQGHHAGSAPGVIYDAQGGILSRVHLEGDRVIYSEETTAEANQQILDYAHAMREANQQHKLSARTRPVGRHVGVMPGTMFYRLWREYKEKHEPYGIDEQTFWAKKLNSSEIVKLRTTGCV